MMKPDVPGDDGGERVCALLHEDGLTGLALKEGNRLPPHLHLQSIAVNLIQKTSVPDPLGSPIIWS